jgi:Ankyrin repeats (many copies)
MTDSTQDKELLERYRRASDSEAAAPSEAVRAAILAEGRRVAAQQATRASEPKFDSSRPAANDARWKITAFGTAGAAILAALLFAPRYWESQMTPMHAKTEGASTSQSTDAAPGPSLAEVKPPAPESPSAQSALVAKVAPPATDVPTAKVASNAPSEEPLALEPRKNLRIARERPQVETIAPSTAADNYAPAAPPAAPPPAPAAAQLAAPQASVSAVTGGARSMSADRATAARIYSPQTPLLSAAASGDLVQATGLLDHGAPVDARDELGRTALMLAATQGRLDMVRLLLERGADPNAADNAGRTPLQQAKQRNLPDVVALLERAGAR